MKHIWVHKRRARAHLSTSVIHLDRPASSESESEHFGNSFKEVIVERELILAHQKRSWIHKRRARSHLSAQARQMYPEGPFGTCLPCLPWPAWPAWLPACVPCWLAWPLYPGTFFPGSGSSHFQTHRPNVRFDRFRIIRTPFLSGSSSGHF